MRGDPGSEGLRGFVGSQGSDGNPGVPGLQGMMGDIGPKGKNLLKFYFTYLIELFDGPYNITAKYYPTPTSET